MKKIVLFILLLVASCSTDLERNLKSIREAAGSTGFELLRLMCSIEAYQSLDRPELKKKFEEKTCKTLDRGREYCDTEKMKQEMQKYVDECIIRKYDEIKKKTKE